MSEGPFEGRVALVTGAGAGMGREHARLLARLGSAVVVNDLADTAKETVDLITGEGGRALAVQADVSAPEGAQAAVEAARSELGGLHVVVSNAAIIKNVPFGEMDFAEFDRVMKVNAYGAFNVLNAAWPHLVEQGYGRVVMVSSSSAWIQQPLIGHYAASKGAVLGLAKTLAAEGAPHGITVNVLAPGAFTAMAGVLEDEEARKRVEIMMPASLVSPAVAWLTREDNTHNGQIFEVSAGRAARNFVGSTKGFWRKDLSYEDLLAHEAEVLDTEGFSVIEDTVELTRWMTETNTGWAAEFEKS
jgi:NAD(P)-dependent dehydrogenase (short-subunit alcohol dehydrogenase family)